MEPRESPPTAPPPHAADVAAGDERLLIERASRGDESAFAVLVDRYAAMVFGLAYASTLSRADAEDVVQETFLTAWRGLARFRGEAGFSTWLYGLARSRCADRARRAAVRPRLASMSGGSAATADAVVDPERRRTAMAIFEAAGRLPLPQRQAVLLRDVQGFSYEEIAVLQDVPMGTVRSRIAAARRQIAAEVGES